MNLENPRHLTEQGFEGFETSSLTILQKNSGPEEITKTPAEGADKTDNSAQTAVLSVLSGDENDNFSDDQRPRQKCGDPLTSHPVQESGRRRGAAYCGQDWKPDTKIRPDDPERYADALRLHGPASYGMMMRVLGWGGTRAGRAEEELHKQGRIAFDNRGFALLIDQQGQTDD